MRYDYWSRSLAFVAALVFAGAILAQAPTRRLPPPGIEISAADRAELSAGAAALRQEIDALAPALGKTKLAARLPDVEVLHKAVDWALRYDEFFDAKQLATARHLLAMGRERAAQLKNGQTPWVDATGLVIRGYRSRLDGSVQPYGLVVPPGWNRTQPGRLMVWALGRGEKRTELAFMAEREAGPPQLTPRQTLILVPYGRFCNAEKFAGEVDVFEALSATNADYEIDPNRIIVAGFSMGGASTWHLATQHAGRWNAAAPGAGFVEVPVYTKAFAPGKEPPTWWEQKLWHWYSSTDYAGNLFNLPTVAYSGEIDAQKQAADAMAGAMQAEGLTLTHLIGPKTGHAYHPETKIELTRRLEALADKGRDPSPAEVKATTYTLRYPGETWVRFEGLGKHWERADMVARNDGGTVTITTKNTTALSIALPAVRSVTIDGQKVAVGGGRSTGFMFHRVGERWESGFWGAGSLRKHPGLTGPIDDAFMERFLFVRPTGNALNAATEGWVKHELAAATTMWRDIFRGDAPVKDDSAVTDQDIANSNLILWGDPSSNVVLRRMLGKLPLQWSAQKLVFRGKEYDAAHHAPILIFPNPLNPQHYVVLNSGIDFRDHAYGTNALQIPKLPDYAVIDLREPPGPRWPGKIVDAGFFDESWK